MYGMNNYGGGYGGRGRGGGSEMIMIAACVLCCVCLCSCILGYFSNMFCGISTGLGKSCTPVESPAPEYEETMPVFTDTPGPAPGTYCNPTYAGQSRAATDPRPPLKPEACVSAPAQTGRDCFYWQTQPDSLTGLAKWVRVVDPNNPKVNAYNKSCTPNVTGPDHIDFTSPAMAGYTDNNAASLLKLFKTTNTTASTTQEMIPLITTAAKRAGVPGWGTAQSTLWVSLVGPSFIGRNIAPHITNTGQAVETVKRKLNLRSVRAATFAAMLEASVNPPNNTPDWINSTATNSWSRAPNIPGKKLPLNETGYVTYLQWASKRQIKNWPKLINNPQYLK